MPVLEEGQIFERYFVIRCLGSGISGESYEAKDLMLQQKVTLKLIHPWAPLPDAARRQFFREMQSISRLSHPYLAAVLDYGENNGKLYVARRYTTSGSLLGNDGRMWFRPQLNVADALRYTYQMAQVLEYIHNHGFLHGSLTFANILVLRGPNVENDPQHAPFLLADVGLANFVRRFGQPQISLLPITAAPEQLGKRVTLASDQFALAVLLFSWLAGRPPYLGSAEEVEQLKLSESMMPLRSFNPKVTDEQEAVLRRALAVYPDERYPSVIAFADALLATMHLQEAPSHKEPAPPVSLEKPEPVPPSPGIPIPMPEPNPNPEPLPGPGSLPNPQPDPSPETEPKPVPEPEVVPEPIPPAPDVPLPIPEPDQSPPLASSPPAILMLSSEEMALPIQNEASPLIARFIITSPYTQEPQEVLLEGNELTLGRAGSSNILLDYDPQTSRHHAVLKHESRQYAIYDRQSVSGVFVNGQKLVGDTGQVLSDGDHVHIGSYELVFRSGVVSAVN